MVYNVNSLNSDDKITLNGNTLSRINDTAMKVIDLISTGTNEIISTPKTNAELKKFQDSISHIIAGKLKTRFKA